MTQQQNNEWEDRLSEIIHDVWSHWQKYLHSKCEIKVDKVSFPIELFEQWERQYTTSYSILSEKEKESDREIFRKFYKEIIEKELEKAYEKGKKEGDNDYVENIKEQEKSFRIGFSEGRLQTLEEVEKVIKEKASLKTDDKVVDIAILLFSEYILQQLNKMKEHERHN